PSKTYWEAGLVVNGWANTNARPSKFDANPYLIFTQQATDPYSISGSFYGQGTSQADAIAASTQTFPDWAYYKGQLIQARMFEPTDDVVTGAPAKATVSGNVIFQDYVKAMGTTAPTGF